MGKWWLAVVIVLFWGCTPGPNEQSRGRTTQEIQFTVTQYSEIGYGSVYTIETDEKPARVLALTVLVGETDQYPSLGFESLKKSYRAQFVFDSNNAPYRTMPVTGFVDADRKIWKLKELTLL